jgi:hypothetical protein
MKFTFFKNLFGGSKSIAFVKSDLDKKVDSIIESEQYSILIELISNGYNLRKEQRKSLFLLGYNEALEGVNIDFPIKKNFNSEKWANCIQEISNYDKKIIPEFLDYFTIMMSTQKIHDLLPHFKKRVLDKYDSFFGCSHCFDLSINFLKRNEKAILENSNYQMLSNLLAKSKMLRFEDNYRNEISSYQDKLAKTLEVFVNKALNVEKNDLINEVLSTNVNKALANKITDLRIQKAKEEFNPNEIPNQAKQYYLDIQNNIQKITSMNNLNDIQKIEFNQLVEKLPQIINEYLSCPKDYKNAILPNQDKSVEILFIENLQVFSTLINNFNEANMVSEVEKLKVTNHYLKAKM